MSRHFNVMPVDLASSMVVSEGDLSDATCSQLLESTYLAMDLETSGLDFASEAIGSIQICDDRGSIYIVRPPYQDATNIRRLLEEERILKVFHHAMFDLRFLAFHFGLSPTTIACTKIAAKILRPGSKNTSLRTLVDEYLGVELNKDQQLSNWLSRTLSDEQLVYAARDVIYLHALLQRLLREAELAGVSNLVFRSFDYIPTRVYLDLLKVGDAFTY